MKSIQPPFLKLIRAAGPFLALLVVILFFSLQGEVRDYFLTIPNFKIILVQTVIVGVAAMGMTMIIVSGGIDLSVGSVVALCGVVAAFFLEQGQTAFLAVTAAIGAGLLVGAVNGALIAQLRLMPFIVTLGMLGMARGAAKWLAGNQTVNYPDHGLNRLMDSDPLSWVPAPGVWCMLFLVLVMAFVMQRTIFGRHLFALGSNEEAARLCGLPVARLKILTYALAGCLFGLAGLLQMSRLNQGDPTVAVGLELDVIAAVVIGGASLRGGTGSVTGALVGALIMAVLRNGSQQMGWPTYVQEIMIGAVIIIAVWVDRLRHGRWQATS